MVIPLALVVAALALVLVVWAGVFALRDRPVVLNQLLGAAVVEVAILAEAVVAVVHVVGGAHVREPGTFVGYMFTTLVVLPFAASWAFAERTRWSSVVMVVAGITVAFLQVRLLQVWGAM